MKFLITFFLICAIAEANEPSAFGAGDLESKNPYGLSTAEKNLLKTRKSLENVDSKVKDVKFTLKSISERVDGLESIYESDSQKLNSSVFSINDNSKKIEEISTVLEKQRLDINQIQTNIEQIQLMQEEFAKNISTLKLAFENLNKITNTINDSYISDDEFKLNMDQFITRSEFEALKKSLKITSNKKTLEKSKSNKLTFKNNAEMFNEAYDLFKRDLFSKAIPLFEKLIENHYKPAASNFYLGEMWYYRDRYDDAIRYFKASAMRYDKASYMPKLLLHSAISFEKTNDTGNAVNFYTSLIDLYPNTEEAKEAVKNLKKLK